MAKMERFGIRALTCRDKAYPSQLKEIYDYPPVLYVRGTLTREDNLAISIVGSRQCSLYGQEQSSRFAHLLGSAGFTICSGLARGIDTAAHQGALSAGGRTIAVQGCGLANVFPPENKRLFELIAESGACVSELPLKYEPLSVNFPPRNRIIAGLSLGTIVIEAQPRSGALITAKAALDYNREVMAVPGKVDTERSRGCHRLIKDGAALVEDIGDVLEALGPVGEALAESAGEQRERDLWSDRPSRESGDSVPLPLKGDEATVYAALSDDPVALDVLVERCEMPIARVSGALVLLELKRVVRQLAGKHFVRGGFKR